MATTTFEFEPSDFAAMRRLGVAMLAVGLSAQRAAKAFSDVTGRVDPFWAILPGEWPDNFVLLNRYLRTGVKPRFLLNE